MQETSGESKAAIGIELEILKEKKNRRGLSRVVSGCVSGNKKIYLGNRTISHLGIPYKDMK